MKILRKVGAVKKADDIDFKSSVQKIREGLKEVESYYNEKLLGSKDKTFKSEDAKDKVGKGITLCRQGLGLMNVIGL